MHYALWPKMLALLKEQYMKAACITEADFDKERTSDKHRGDYSLRDHRINLICEGCMEKADEVAYIASRKALNFNLFGADMVSFKENELGIAEGTYKIRYGEKVLLNKAKNSIVTLDTILDGGEEVEIVRTRFLEWIVLKKRLIKDSFLDARRYFYPDAGSAFADSIKKMLAMYSTDGGEYWSNFSHIDALFVIKELIAAYNLLSQDKIIQKENLKKLNIIEGYWKPIDFGVLDQYAAKLYLKEKKFPEEIDLMLDLIAPVTELFQDKFGVSVDIKYIDMWSLLDAQKCAEDKITWMQRYMV